MTVTTGSPRRACASMDLWRQPLTPPVPSRLQVVRSPGSQRPNWQVPQQHSPASRCFQRFSRHPPKLGYPLHGQYQVFLVGCLGQRCASLLPRVPEFRQCQCPEGQPWVRSHPHSLSPEYFQSCKRGSAMQQLHKTVPLCYHRSSGQREEQRHQRAQLPQKLHHALLKCGSKPPQHSSWHDGHHCSTSQPTKIGHPPSRQALRTLACCAPGWQAPPPNLTVFARFHR
mmetsp:Transcript_104960/g.208653  ORF Transcript_104960/g.208653 Transcript_104960/m.208653 type:complete len:227 (+) Transcript_104960:398-1078(+)